MFILDFNKVKTGDGPLYGVKNYSIKKKTNTLDTFKFDIPNDNPFSDVVKSEYYFQNEDNLFVIKSLKPGDEYVSVEGRQDVEAIENKLWLDGFDCPTSSLLDMARLAIAGTGWTVEVVSGPTYKRSLKLDKTDTLTVLQKVAEKFNVEIKFDSLKKVVKFATQFGSDRGVYFSDQLNASKVYNQNDTKDFATRIVARGKDGLTFADINGGKDYVEDYTYSNKLKVYMWSDARYTIAENLLEDAKLRLSVMCKPQQVYEVSIIDLVNHSEYSFLQYDLGDTVTIMNSKAGYKDVQRITELTKYPQEPERSSVTLANCALTLEDINSKTEESMSKVDESFNEDGTINASKIDGEFEMEIADGSITVDKLAANSVNAEKIQANAITADKIKAGEIKAGHIEAGTIKANSAIIDDLAITTAKIAEAAITVAKIEEGFIDKLVVSQGKFESAHIKNGAIDTAQIHDAAITNAKIGKLAVGSANIQEASIETAHIKELDAGKITTGDLTADVIKGKVISAINLSVETAKIDSAKIGDLTADKITTGDLKADRIKASVISAINISTETATINSAKIGDLSADKIKTGDLSADRIKTNVISAINASIGKISADRIDVDSIKVGNIDAGQITTGDLDADRIKANVISAINGYMGTAKIKQAQIETLTVGDANIVDATISGAKIAKASITDAQIANATITDAKIKNLNAAKINTGTLDASKVTISSVSGNLNISDNTIQIKDSQATPKVRVQIGKDKNNNYGILVMNAAGNTIFDSDYGVYEPGIKNDAVSKDKIKDGAVDVNKLNLDSLFVGDSAFINRLSAVEIDAAQITTGKIQGERIDIVGLITFEALDTSLQPIFDVQGDKTYINGGMIATNTIKADKIDLLSGLTVKGPDNTTTFAIRSDGNVEVNGLLRSGNFNEERKTGYQISPNGEAILNQATIRGNIILPNSGMTNDYDMSQVEGRNILQSTNQGISGWGWGMGTGGRTFTEVIEDGIRCCKVVRDDVAQSGWSYLNYSMFDPGVIQPATKYTLSFEVKASVATTFQFRICRGDGKEILTNWSPSSQSTVKDEWTKLVMTATSLEDLTAVNRAGQVMYIAGMNSGVGVSYTFRNIKLEEGEVENPEWLPAPEDNLNPVRMWAGSSYELRDNAPFRVMQNGDVYATNGTFSGKMFGALNAGLVHIHDDEIVINSTNTYIDEYGVEQSIEPRDYNPDPYLRLGKGLSLLNTDFILGSQADKRIEFLNGDRSLTFNETTLNLVARTKNDGATVRYNPFAGYHKAFTIESNVTNTDASLAIGYHGDSWENTAIITHVGSKGGNNGDICFKRTVNEQNIDVFVQGNLKVRNTIQSNIQNIEMRSVTNEGWGFYAS